MSAAVGVGLGSSAEFDVVIAGGGLVGGSLAVALARSRLKVALIEAVPHDSEAQPSFDDRTLALSQGSCNILKQLGLWPLLQDSVFAIDKIHVSEQGRFGTAVIDAAEQGIEHLGHVIKGRALGNALWQRIAELPELSVVCPARVSAAELAAKGSRRKVQVSSVAGDRELHTRLLVVADGARSPLRESLGVGSRVSDYHQVAIVANVQIEKRWAGHMAYERFLPQGPLAVLPGPAGRYTIVLARDAAAAGDYLQMPDSEFLQVLQTGLGFRLGRLKNLGKRVSYPLSLVQTEKLAARRAVMIGNAANGLHPVAGQGFNLGLRDVASLAELLADDMAGGVEQFDPGADDLLQAYTDWRQDDHRNVVTFTDGLIRLFGRSGELLSRGRGLGLTLFDVLPAGKRELARQTMGLGGRMTRLARGLDL